MKNIKSIIWGIVLIALGVIWAGNALNLFDIDVFFKGWWTLFLIIPSLAGIVSNEDKKGDLIVFTIGILLLLACNKIIDFDLVWELIFPIIIIVIGLSLIFKNTVSKEVNKKIKDLNEKVSEENEYAAVFSSQEVKADVDFKGTNVSAVFGELKLDLTKCKLKDDVVVNASCIFGGVTIYVPDDVKIVVKSNSIFGSVSNKKNSSTAKGSKTIYVNGSCVFGGVDIK